MDLWQVRKSVIVKGNLSSEKFCYRPVESEFVNKFSFIAIHTVSFRSNRKLNKAIAIKCNFVTENRFNPVNKRLESYEMPLAVFQMKTSGLDSLTVTRMTPIWFKLNALSENLEFQFENIEDDSPCDDDCLVMISVFFK